MFLKLEMDITTWAHHEVRLSAIMFKQARRKEQGNDVCTICKTEKNAHYFGFWKTLADNVNQLTG